MPGGTQQFRRQPIGGAAGHDEGLLAPAGDGRGDPAEVPVVGDVAGEVDRAVRAAGLDERRVGLRRLHVVQRGVVVAADADVDVRRHVHQVSGRGCQVGQPVGVGLGPLRLAGLLDGVDVQVNGAYVIRIEAQGLLQGGDDLRGPGPLLAVGEPEVPGVQVHQRFGGQGENGRIFRIAGGDDPHRVGVRLVQSGAIVGLHRLIAFEQSRGQCLFERTGSARQIAGPGRQVVGPGGVAGIHGGVDVGAEHQRAPPVAHAAIRIVQRGFGEGEIGGSVIEREGEREALIEVALRGRGPGGDRQVQIAEAVEQRLAPARFGGIVRGGSGCGRVTGGGGGARGVGGAGGGNRQSEQYHHT